MNDTNELDSEADDREMGGAFEALKNALLDTGAAKLMTRFVEYLARLLRGGNETPK